MIHQLIRKCGTYGVLFAVCCVLSAPTFAQVPHLIRYQGSLTDSTGQPLQGEVALTFSLYPAATGGTPLWTESQPAVPVANGQFSVLLGSVTPLDPVDWSQPLYLGITVNADPEMTPRQPITSVPTAILAEQLSGAITTVGNNVGIGTTMPANTFSVSGSADFSGNVGIGTTAPTATLDVTGTVKIADGTQGAAKVLTSDAGGGASWQTLPPGVPTGAIILWADSAACPSGYTRLSAYDNTFLVGGSDAVTTGGSTTHNHGGSTGSYALSVNEIPSHSHTLPTDACGSGSDMQSVTSTDNADESYGCMSTGSAGGGAGHSHSIGSVDHRPPFRTILLCKKD